MLRSWARDGARRNAGFAVPGPSVLPNPPVVSGPSVGPGPPPKHAAQRAPPPPPMRSPPASDMHARGWLPAHDRERKAVGAAPVAGGPRPSLRGVKRSREEEQPSFARKRFPMQQANGAAWCPLAPPNPSGAPLPVRRASSAQVSAPVPGRPPVLPVSGLTLAAAVKASSTAAAANGMTPGWVGAAPLGGTGRTKTSVAAQRRAARDSTAARQPAPLPAESQPCKPHSRPPPDVKPAAAHLPRTSAAPIGTSAAASAPIQAGGGPEAGEARTPPTGNANAPATGKAGARPTGKAGAIFTVSACAAPTAGANVSPRSGAAAATAAATAIAGSLKKSLAQAVEEMQRHAADRVAQAARSEAAEARQRAAWAPAAAAPLAAGRSNGVAVPKPSVSPKPQSRNPSIGNHSKPQIVTFTAAGLHPLSSHSLLRNKKMDSDALYRTSYSSYF